MLAYQLIEERAQVREGNMTSVLSRFELQEGTPGLISVVLGVGRVSIQVPGPGNTVSGEFTEFVEVMPVVSASAGISS